MFTTASTRLLSAALLAASLAACDQHATLRGKVSDQPGTQQQGLSDTGGLGGSGTTSVATSVRLMSVGADGSLTAVATGQLSASGEYTIQFAGGGDQMVVQALDAQGTVVASGVVSDVQADGATHAVAPIDSETSVEASVLVQMLRRGADPAKTNAVDVRARINASIAAAVKSSSDPDAKIQALADATIAAQQTEARSYQQAGLTVTEASLASAELTASAHLDAALDRGDSAETAYATFFTELQAARAQAGVTAQQQAKAESCSSASFRATLQARLSASGSADPVVDASLRQEAALEAGASAAAVEATLRAAGAADASVNAAVNAAATLRASMSAATTAAASAQAIAAYRASIEGSASVQGSVLGTFLGVDAITAVTADASLAATATAAATLDATLGSSFDAALSTAGTVNFSALADTVVSAYATYDTAVHAQASALAVFGSKASAAMDVMVVASGSYSNG